MKKALFILLLITLTSVGNFAIPENAFAVDCTLPNIGDIAAQIKHFEDGSTAAEIVFDSREKGTSFENAEIANFRTISTNLSSFRTSLSNFATNQCGVDAFDMNNAAMLQLQARYTQLNNTKNQKYAVPNWWTAGYLNEHHTLFISGPPSDFKGLNYANITGNPVDAACERILGQASSANGGTISANILIAEVAIRKTDQLLSGSTWTAESPEVNKTLDDATTAWQTALADLDAAKAANCNNNPTYKAAYDARHDEILKLMDRLNTARNHYSQASMSPTAVVGQTATNVAKQLGFTCDQCKGVAPDSLYSVISKMIEGLCCFMYSILKSLQDFLQQVSDQILNGLNNL